MSIETYRLARQLADDEIARLRAMDYDEYLQTGWWKHVRLRAIERARGICELCMARDAVEVHHTSYASLGAEPPYHLVALCRSCHQHIEDNGLGSVSRERLIGDRLLYLYSPEFRRPTKGEL